MTSSSLPLSVSSLIDPLTLGAQPTFVSLTLPEKDLIFLAEMVALPHISYLSGSFKLTLISKDMVRVEGEIKAEFQNLCVVTLEPFESSLQETVDIRFASPEKIHTLKEKEEETNEPHHTGYDKNSLMAHSSMASDSWDTLEPFQEGKIDLIDLIYQTFCLHLDPYPKKPGAVFVNVEEEKSEKDSPFAVLKNLKH